MTGSVAQFALAGLVVTVALAALTGVLARRAGLDQATRSFEHLARNTAAALSPSLDAAPSADPATRAELRLQVEALHRAGPIVRVTVWDAQGRILWSDEPGLVGRVFRLPPEQLRVLADGSVGSDIADLDRPENHDERGMGPLLEAFVGVRDIHGSRLLVDVMERYDDAVTAARQTWLRFAPAALGALVLLQLVQVPLAWRLARRLRLSRETEQTLLQTAMDAAETERRRIAGELHDHVVQDLTGLAYDLDAARLREAGRDEADRLLIARTASALRRSISDLRTLLVSLMPARLPREALEPALESLAAGLAASGIALRVNAAGTEDLPRPVAALLYRCAQEALRNVATHSGATTVDLSARAEEGSVTMVIDDDGRGFDEQRLRERGDSGHLGLRALGDLLAETGGSLTAASAPGQGTRLVATVPLETRRVGAGAVR